MLSIIEKVIFLQNVDVFSEVPTEQLARLAAITEEISFSDGQTVYEADQPADALYLVLDGQVRMEREGRKIAVAENREAFGTWALFDDEPRVVTAVTEGDSRLLRIDREDFVDLLADHVQIAQGVLKTVVGRMRNLMERASGNSKA